MMEVICYACGRGENLENTLTGIRHCQTINPNWIVEMDIQITQDSEVVLFHDDDLYRMTGVSGRLEDYDYAELPRLKSTSGMSVGSMNKSNDNLIPKLNSVFEAFPNAKFLLDVHSQNSDLPRFLIEMIEAYNFQDQVIIVSKFDQVMYKFKKERPSWKYGAASIEAKKVIFSTLLAIDSFFGLKSDILMIPKTFKGFTTLGRRIVRHVHSRNKKIWAWVYEGESVKNVNSIEDWKDLEDIGVDGVFTDFPSRLSLELDELEYS